MRRLLPINRITTTTTQRQSSPIVCCCSKQRSFFTLFHSRNELLKQIKEEYKTLPRDELLLDGRKTKIYGFIKTPGSDNNIITEKPDFSQFLSSTCKLIADKRMKSSTTQKQDIIALHYRVEKEKMFSNELFVEYLLFKTPVHFIFQRNLKDESTRELIQIDLSDRQLVGDFTTPLKQDELLTILKKERTLHLSAKDLTPLLDSIKDYSQQHHMKLVDNDLNFHHDYNGKIIIKESVIRNGDLLMLMGQTNRVINYDEFTCSLISAFSEDALMNDISKIV